MIPFFTTLCAMAPLLAQTTAPAETQNGILLGSWKTQVVFDDVKVVSGSKGVFSDSFNTQSGDWSTQSGDWGVADGVYRQTSNATPALTRFTFKSSDTHYVASVRAKKLSGAEGFLIGFGLRDSQNFYWLNVGGWGNTATSLEITVDGDRRSIGPRVDGKIETDRWYDVKVEVTGQRIQCSLDNRSIIDLTDDGFRQDSSTLPPDMVADPSIVDIEGTFYCYATTDGWGQGLDTSGTPVVWTSKDFLNWSFEGSSFPSDFDLKYWAPSTIGRRNGRYYSFPTLDGKITAVTADSPTGPFLAPDGRHVTRGRCSTRSLSHKRAQ